MLAGYRTSSYPYFQSECVDFSHVSLTVNYGSGLLTVNGDSATHHSKLHYRKTAKTARFIPPLRGVAAAIPHVRGGNMFTEVSEGGCRVDKLPEAFEVLRVLELEHLHGAFVTLLAGVHLHRGAHLLQVRSGVAPP